MLHVYYTNRVLLFILCGGNELCFILLYVLHFKSAVVSTFPFELLNSLVSVWWEILFVPALAMCVAKQLISLMQLLYASDMLVRYELYLKDRKKP